MMEKVSTIVESTQQHYTPHLKKVLKTYQKSAIKSLQGPSTVLCTVDTGISEDIDTVKKEPGSESSPELPSASTDSPSAGTPLAPPLPPAQAIPQVPILSTADTIAELSETLIEGHRISCFIIGGEKRIIFAQLLSTALRNVQAHTINIVCAELFINFSSCNSEQLLALKAKGLLPSETPTCGLVTKPDAERLCSVLLHEGGTAPESLEKQVECSFLVYHECFSGARGILYYEFYTEKNWCIQCVVCRRLFSPQMFVCHSCYMDKKRNSIHTYIETGICHWGFDSANWKLYIHVLEGQPDYDKCVRILENFKKHHRRSEFTPLKRKQVLPTEVSDPVKLVKLVAEESIPAVVATTIPAATTTSSAVITTTTACTTATKVERVDNEDEDERWYMKKKAKVVTSATVHDRADPYTPLPPAFYEAYNHYYAGRSSSWNTSDAALSYSWPHFTQYQISDDYRPYYLSDSIPPFPSSRPVLLHPERVVPLSQTEHFERSFQPNVALAPPSKIFDSVNYTKFKRGAIRVKNEVNPSSLEDTETSSPLPNSGLAREDVTEKSEPLTKSLRFLPPNVPCVPTSTVGSCKISSPVVPSTPDNGVSSVVEQVASVLDALSDAEDAVRQRVISLVERLTLKIDQGNVECQKLQDENLALRSFLAQLQEENMKLFYDYSLLKYQLDYKDNEEKCASESDTSARSSSPTTVTVNTINQSNPSNSNTPGISLPKQPNCSPVSVITSPPPLCLIKLEPGT